jgi:hypothetical protein
MSIGSFTPGTGALAQNSPPRKVYLAFDLEPFRAGGGRAGTLETIDGARPITRTIQCLRGSRKPGRS